MAPVTAVDTLGQTMEETDLRFRSRCTPPTASRPPGSGVLLGPIVLGCSINGGAAQWLNA